MTKLSTIAKQAFGGEEIDRILDLPMTQLILELKGAYQGIKEKKPFTEKDFSDFIAKLGKQGKIEKQIEAARYAIEHREAENDYDIELNTREKQLLWAAVLTRMMSDKPKEDVTQSPLWRQINNSLGLHNESIRVSVVIAEAMQNDQVTFAWGAPGTWFYNDPQKNHINLDLYHSLLVGFEYVRSVHLHEIGHSQLTNSYPPDMQKIYESRKAIIEKIKNDDDATATKEEQKQLALDSAYWNLWFSYFNRVEDVCVDQFAYYMEHRVNQDFSDSMNHAATLLRGYAEIYSGKSVEDQLKKISSDQAEADILEKILGKADAAQDAKKQADYLKLLQRPLTAAEVADIKAGNISPEIAQRVFDEVSNGALLASYVQNGLITGNPSAWEKFHIFAEDINRLIDVSGVPAAKGLSAFEYLCKLSVDEKYSLRTLQPRPSDRFMAPAGKSLAQNYRDIVKQTTEKRCELMQHIWDIYLKPYADVLKKEFEKQIEKQLEQMEQNGDGEGNEQQPGQGDGDSQPGQGNGNGKSQQGQGGGPVKISKKLKDMVKNMSKDPSKQREKQQEKNKQNRPGAEGKKEEASADKDKQKVGDLKDRKIAKEELTEEDKKALRKKAKDMPDVAPDALDSGGGAGKQRGVDLEALQKGDWREYDKRVAELWPVILQVARKYKSIVDEQTRAITRQAKSHEFMADDGDVMGMLDRDKVLNTKFRQASKASLSSDDFKKFHEMRIETMRSTVEKIGLIDGSGSMTYVQIGRSDAMGAAIQSAVIEYEASLLAGMDPFIFIWGGDLILVASPDSNRKEVGERLESLRKGTGSGTNLAPGLIGTVETLAEHRTKSGTISGSSHITVYSDGDIYDVTDTEKMLETIVQGSKNLSVDVAVLGPKDAGTSSMEKVFTDVMKKSAGSKMLSVIRGHDPNAIPLQLAENMYKRVKAVKIVTEPDSKKRMRLKQLHNKMKKN